MRPHEMLLQSLVESFREAGFTAEVDGAELTLQGVSFWCQQLWRKTGVRFLGRLYTFTRRGMNPPAQTAVNDVFAQLGAIMASRERRRKAVEAAAERDRARLLKEQEKQERVEAVRRMLANCTYGRELSDNVFEMQPGLRIAVKDDTNEVTFSSADLGLVFMAADWLSERGCE